MAEMTIFVKKLNKSKFSSCFQIKPIQSISLFNNLYSPDHLELYAREHGVNKLSASKACALMLIRQLFQHGLIEAFNGVNESKEPIKVTTKAKFDY